MTTFPRLNYIGSKYKLIPEINQFITDLTQNSEKVCGDLFSGNSAISLYFRQNGKQVIANDMEYYAFVLSQAYLNVNYTTEIEIILSYLNKTTPIKGLIFHNYAPLKSSRMYFTNENAMKIDGIRNKLERLKRNEIITQEEYYYCLASLLIAADRIANIPSVYGCYLKSFKDSAKKPISLVPIHKEKLNGQGHIILQDDANNVILKHIFDLVYLDPPYNERQYSKNYHILNYIAKYDKNLEIYGKTGLIKNSYLSNFCKRGNVKETFVHLISNIKAKYIVLSYNSEGFLTKDEIFSVLSTRGKVKIKEMPYKRFKSFKYNKNKDLTEYLFGVKIE